MNTNEVAVIILAAGQSTRFGSPKMSHCLSNGMSVLANTVAQYKLVFTNISVVIPECRKLINEFENSDVQLVFNTQSDLGMSQSIIAGIRAQPNARAWLIALGDMPYIKVASLKECAHQASENTIVVPTYKRKTGHPVIFGSAFRDQGLLNLSGDVGAKSVIEKCIDSVSFAEVNDLGVLHDIDRPSDIQLTVELTEKEQNN